MTYSPNISAIADTIREEADRTHAAYPQYRGFWNSADWRLVQITRKIRTKAGLAFTKGEYTLARLDESHEDFLTAYSVRTTYNTLIKASDARWME